MPVDTDFLRQISADQAEQGQQAEQQAEQQAGQGQQGGLQQAQAQLTNLWPQAQGNTGIASPPQLPTPGQPGDLLVVGSDGRATWMNPRDALQLRVELPDGTVLSRETIEQGFVITDRYLPHAAERVIGEVLRREGIEPLGPTNADVIRGLYGTGPKVVLAPRPSAWDRLLADDD